MNRGQTDLNLRLAIGNAETEFNPASNGSWYATTTAVSLPVGSTDWESITFDLTEDAMTSVLGSDSLAEVLANERFQERLAREVPAARIGEPHETAELALFLASAISSFICGQIISQDGGWT